MNDPRDVAGALLAVACLLFASVLVLLTACGLEVASKVTGAVPLSRYLPIGLTGLAGERERERERLID